MKVKIKMMIVWMCVLATLSSPMTVSADTAVSGGISRKNALRSSQIQQGPNGETRYKAGQYKVGTDISAGEYILFTSDGLGYFAVSSDSNGDDIIVNDNFTYNSIISVSSSQYLKLSHCYAVPFDEVDVDDLKLDGEGMFKVGKHIPAGEYKLNSDTSEEGYYCIYDSSAQMDIVSNDIFEGDQYVTVQNGQYLKLVRCRFDSIPKMTYEDAVDDVSIIDGNGEENVKKTQANLSMYLEALGQVITSDNVYATDEFINGLSNVWVMGKGGTVNHEYATYNGNAIIDMMTWCSNEKYTHDDFISFVPKLDELFDERRIYVSYYEVSDEVYAWDDSENACTVISWYDDKNIYVRWIMDEYVEQRGAYIVDTENSADKISLEEESQYTKNESYEDYFTNEYGTPTTKCAHPLCDNYIAPSGDTNCCIEHSNRCLQCNKYIDEDALFCLDCLKNAIAENIID